MRGGRRDPTASGGVPGGSGSREFLVDRNPSATQHIYLFSGTGSFVYYFTRNGQFRQTNATYILSSDPLRLDPVLRIEHVEPDSKRSPPGKSSRSSR